MMPPIPFELRIGVTGHRELDDPDAVRQAVDQVIGQLVGTLTEASRDPHGQHGSLQHFDRWLAKLLSMVTRILCPVVNFVQRLLGAPDRWLWPVTPVSRTTPSPQQQTPLKLTGISCLAIGSDQIVIEAIRDMLSHGDHPAGLVGVAKRNRYVEAVLPFPQDEYEKNYSPEDRVKFRELLELDRGEHDTQTQPTVIYPAFPLDDRGRTVERRQAYRAAGRSMVDTSELVIAIWDPSVDEESQDEPVGGTADTAIYAVNHGKLVIWIHPGQLQQGASVLRLRQPDSDPASSGGSEWNRRPIDAPKQMDAFEIPTRAKILSPNFHRLAAYNRDNAVSQTELDNEYRDKAAEFERCTEGKLPPSVPQTIVRHILPHMVRADALSRRYRDLRSVAAWLWPTVAAFAVTMMGIQIFFLPNWYPIAWIELSLLLFCLLAYRVSLYDAWHDKWLNDRRLAEGLRTALYSSLVTAPDQDNDSAAADSSEQRSAKEIQNPLPFYNPGQSWLVGTVKRLVRRERHRFASAIDWNTQQHFEGIRSFLVDDWIGGQIAYHNSNVRRLETKARKYERLHFLVIGAIVVFSVLHALGIGHHHDAQHDHTGLLFARVDIWIALLTSVLPAWAAAVHALSTADDHERMAERSQRMTQLLRGLAERIKKADSRQQLEVCVREAEELFDLENQEWAESLSDRSPVVSG